MQVGAVDPAGDAGPQLGPDDRLDHHVVGARLEHGVDRLGVAVGREEDDARLLPAVVGAQHPAQLDATDLGHVDVEHDDVGVVVVHGPPELLLVVDRDEEPHVLVGEQDAGNGAQDHLVVVHRDDGRRAAPPRTTATRRLAPRSRRHSPGSCT